MKEKAELERQLAEERSARQRLVQEEVSRRLHFLDGL